MFHFGGDKTKFILFGITNKKSCSKKLDIRRGDIKIKQPTTVTYLGSIHDENLSGESMATRAPLNEWQAKFPLQKAKFS